MEASIILGWLDKLHALVQENTLPDGTIPVDKEKVEVVLELCEKILLEGLQAPY